ncbi:MAG: sulfotransferase [Actinomycetota bacterium]
MPVTRQPIFLLSLPRSGSTLVQRVLASTNDIATAPEPWFLLPQAYALRERGVEAEYVQVSSARAIHEFANQLPNGIADYRSAVRDFALRLYDLHAGDGGGRYFLDKTPRYHLIIDDLFEIFPDARFVFLWRNPLAVAASIVETWAGGRWAAQRWHVDLFDGVANLTAGFRAHEDAALGVRIEDLVGDPLTAWPQVFAHLDLPFDPAVLSSFSELRLDGRMGDPTGVERYRELSTEPLEKWKGTLRSPIRKRWARDYLRWIGEERLAVMGYDLGELLRELESVPTRARGSVSDLARGTYWWADRVGRERAARLLWRRLPR